VPERAPSSAEEKVELGLKPKVRQITLLVAGLCCPSEAPIIDRILKPMPGVQTISIDVASKTVMVRHDQNVCTVAELIAALNAAALDARPLNRRSRLQRRLPRRLAVAGLLWAFSLVCVALGWLKLWRVFAFLCIAVTGVKVAVRAVNSMKRCILDMNVLVLLACSGALCIESYSEAATVLFLFSLAEYLESGVTTQARAAIQEVLGLRPEEAEMRSGAKAPVQDVQVGDIVVVRQGDQVPLDGSVVAGTAVVDESALTGESKPIQKTLGDKVSAGSTSISGYIEVQVSSHAENSMVSKLVQLIETAQSLRSDTERSVERFARIYTPCILCLAIAMMIVPWLIDPKLGPEYFYNTLVLLVIACPCALVISTPVTYLSGIACCATHGILVRGGVHLETLGSTKMLAIDKTGTLTEGSFRVRQFRCQEHLDEAKLWRQIAAVESRSSHPIAAALVAAAWGRGLRPAKDVDRYSELQGEGVMAVVEGLELAIGNDRLARRMGWTSDPALLRWAVNDGTIIWVGSTCGQLLAQLSVADAPRPEAKDAMRILGEAGIDIVMLTGDVEVTASAVAGVVGIRDFRAGLLPDDKISHVLEMRKRCNVAMVGDGVNDVPALAAASVGIAMGAAGRAAALEVADVVLMDSNLEKLVKAFRLGSRVLRKVKQNIAFAILSKLVLVLFTISGRASLWGAIVADVGAMLIVTLNGTSVMSLRRPWKKRAAPPPNLLSSTPCTANCCADKSFQDSDTVDASTVDTVSSSLQDLAVPEVPALVLTQTVPPDSSSPQDFAQTQVPPPVAAAPGAAFCSGFGSGTQARPSRTARASRARARFGITAPDAGQLGDVDAEQADEMPPAVQIGNSAI